MNPGERGWLKKYVSFLRKQLRERPESWPTRFNEEDDPYAFLYEVLQPTGLMYGLAVQAINEAHRKQDEWSEKEKIKVLFAEAFLFVGLYFYHHPSEELNKSVPKVLADVRDFYAQHPVLISRPEKTPFGRRKEKLDQLEYALDRRVLLRYDWRTFWSNFFHNSLLFYDLIFFVSWMEEKADWAHEDMLKRRADLRFEIVMLIAAAAHADQPVHPEEKTIFRFFLQSSNLPSAMRKKAEVAFRKGIKLEDLGWESLENRALKKYFLELAIMTTWANKKISEKEKIFLRKLSHQLDLQDHDLADSMQAVQQFIMQYYDQVHFLQKGQEYRMVSDQFLRRMRRMVKSNQRLIEVEIQQSKELVGLLRRYSIEELSPAEMEKMRTQLVDVLKAIPAFAFLLLPGSFLTLPILLRIIPKHLWMPSAYLAEEEE
ncbi:MAG: hypothetical protein AAFR61_17480 [Bacteroidota bacterium]